MFLCANSVKIDNGGQKCLKRFNILLLTEDGNWMYLKIKMS